MGTVIGKEACPSCRSTGDDKSGDNLARYDDGSAFCFACGHIEKAGGEKVLSSSRAKLTASEVATYPVGGDPLRQLSPDVITRYNIRVTYNESTGKPDYVYYPYYEDGEMTNYKRRSLTEKDFITGGPLPGLFGKEQCRGTDYLIVTEGEEDCLAGVEMLKGMTNPQDVVSLPNGANLKGKIDDTLLNELDFFCKYKRVYLSLDNDKPGQAMSEAIADWLSGGVEVRLMPADKEIGKDASDYLVSGSMKEFRSLIKDARIYEPEGIINGTEISLDDLLEPIPEGYPVPFEGLQHKLHGIRKGEIVTVCAGSGIGKSTLVREITKSLIEQGLSTANVALEDQMNVAAQALMALDMDIPLPIFRFNPPTKSESQASYDKMVANGSTFFYKHFGGLTCDTLLSKLYYYARSKKVDFIVLDHLSMVVSNSKSNDERKDLDYLMTQLAKMVVETGVGLIQIVHLKRIGSGKVSFNKGGEVELSDLRGSSALEQLSWTVFAAERDQQGDDPELMRVRVLKNRTWGFLGLADTLRYNHDTGRLKSVASDIIVPEIELEVT